MSLSQKLQPLDEVRVKATFNDKYYNVEIREGECGFLLDLKDVRDGEVRIYTRGHGRGPGKKEPRLGYYDVESSNLEFVTSHKAEDLVHHEWPRILEVARDDVLRQLLRQGYLRLRWCTSADPTYSGNQLEYVVIKRDKAEVYSAIRTSAAGSVDEMKIKRLQFIDWASVSVMSLEELLTSGNEKVRALASDPNALNYEKLKERFRNACSVAGQSFHNLELSLSQFASGKGFGASKFSAEQKREIIRAFQAEFPVEFIQQIKDMSRELKKRFEAIEQRLDTFVENSKEKAKQDFKEHTNG